MRLYRPHRVQRAGLIAVALAVPALAFAQPNMAGAPTATRPITQPSFTAPTAAPHSLQLPSGAYRLTIEMPANGAAPGRTATDAVALTHTGATLNFKVTSGAVGGGSFGGTIDASGGVNIPLALGSATLTLVGTASGSTASGDAVVSMPGVSEPPHGHFDLVSASLPQAQARPNGLVEAINSLLHAIGCWAHGGAGC